MSDILPIGTRVRHYGQQYPEARNGTATVIDTWDRGPFGVEYLVKIDAEHNFLDRSQSRIAWWSDNATVPIKEQS